MVNSILRRTPLGPALSFVFERFCLTVHVSLTFLQFYRQICKLSQGFEFTVHDLQRLQRQNDKRKKKTRKGGELTVLRNSNVHCKSVVTIRLKHRSLTPFPKLACLRMSRGGHVGGQKQKHFSPLGAKLHFHVNSLK